MNNNLVYKHTSPSGKMYIGITNDYTRRCNEHLSDANLGSTFAFHKAIRKYGWSSFTHEILAINLTKQQAFDMEIALINVAEKGLLYNMTLGGEGVSGEVSRKGRIARRKDTVKGYSWNEKLQKYQVSLGYLGKVLHFGAFTLECDAKERVAYLYNLADKDLLLEYNRYKQNKTKRTKGYTFHKASNKYKIVLTINGKQTFFGYCLTEQEAKDKVKEIRKLHNASSFPVKG